MSSRIIDLGFQSLDKELREFGLEVSTIPAEYGENSRLLRRGTQAVGVYVLAQTPQWNTSDIDVMVLGPNISIDSIRAYTRERGIHLGYIVISGEKDQSARVFRDGSQSEETLNPTHGWYGQILLGFCF